MVKFMIKYRSASLVLAFFCLITSFCGASAQDFLQELFGSDPAPSAVRRATGHKNEAPAYRGGRERERGGSHTFRGNQPQVQRQDDGARSSRGAATVVPHHDDDGASWGNGTEFCVRTCDGYFFPLIKSAQQTKQASCEYACPSAPVAYYHGSSIETARNLSGEKYTSLPTAFKFREKVSAGCTCHPPEESQQHSLKIVKNDPTAHSGDIVVEQKGAFVYQGKQAIPIDRSRQVSASVRQNIQKMTAGPTPVGAIDASGNKNLDGPTTAGTNNNGLLSGAARPMGEVDAAGNQSGDGERATSGFTTALLLLTALGAAVLAVLRLRPDLKDRLLGVFKGAATAPTTIDLIDATDRKTDTQPPGAWVWSQYKAVLQPAAETATAELLSRSSAPMAAKDCAGDDAAGQFAGLSPTSIAWVWSEYRGAF
jgi:hypothetical protein